MSTGQSAIHTQSLSWKERYWSPLETKYQKLKKKFWNPEFSCSQKTLGLVSGFRNITHIKALVTHWERNILSQKFQNMLFVSETVIVPNFIENDRLEPKLCTCKFTTKKHQALIIRHGIIWKQLSRLLLCAVTVSANAPARRLPPFEA